MDILTLMDEFQKRLVLAIRSEKPVFLLLTVVGFARPSPIARSARLYLILKIEYPPVSNSLESYSTPFRLSVVSIVVTHGISALLGIAPVGFHRIKEV